MHRLELINRWLVGGAKLRSSRSRSVESSIKLDDGQGDGESQRSAFPHRGTRLVPVSRSWKPRSG